ncbi:hypothetical protein Bca52824_061687 [Brassica carinata]|uniref:Uncharacterized protein n=1 Tax=Brassica carinata TaxID=52824 RepID=A0A8X7R0C3_BRACI|nr:hypothetical protein Bca52824_061687 [Brassica carinata]
MQESIDSRNLVDGDTATLQMIVENTAGKNQTGGSKDTTLSYEKSMRGGFNLGDQSMELGSTKRVIDLNILKKVFEERRLKSQGCVDTTVMQVPEPRNPQKGWFGFGFTNSKKSKEQSLVVNVFICYCLVLVLCGETAGSSKKIVGLTAPSLTTSETVVSAEKIVESGRHHDDLDQKLHPQEIFNKRSNEL